MVDLIRLKSLRISVQGNSAFGGTRSQNSCYGSFCTYLMSSGQGNLKVCKFWNSCNSLVLCDPFFFSLHYFWNFKRSQKFINFGNLYQRVTKCRSVDCFELCTDIYIYIEASLSFIGCCKWNSQHWAAKSLNPKKCRSVEARGGVAWPDVGHTQALKCSVYSVNSESTVYTVQCVQCTVH